MEALIRASQNRITDASDDLRNGRVDLDAWQSVMRQEIKDVHLTSEALMRGGWKQLSQVDLDRVTQRVKDQYEYLSDFTAKLSEGTMRTDGSFMNYARMYAASAREGFYSGMGDMLMSVGYTEELNVLHPAEHCTECVACTAAGWVPIGSNPRIGTRKCLGNDKCSMKYR